MRSAGSILTILGGILVAFTLASMLVRTGVVAI